MSNVLYRPIKSDDVYVVAKLLDSNLSNFLPLDEVLESNWIAYINQSNFFAVVAEINGEIVGYGSLLIEIKVRGGKLGHIEDICVERDFQKHGIGKAIVGYLMSLAGQAGCYKIAIACKEDNKKFYQGLKFEEDGISMSFLL